VIADLLDATSLQNDDHVGAADRAQCPLLALDPDPESVLALPDPVPGVFELVPVPVPVLMLGAVPLAVPGALVLVAPVPAAPAPMLPDISLPLGSVEPAVVGLFASWLEPPQPALTSPANNVSATKLKLMVIVVSP
jgi:hypothetical protein